MNIKKPILNKIAIALLTMGVVFACDDFLDKEVTGSMLETEFYKTDKDAEYALTATYDQLSNTYNASWSSMYLLKQIISDESNAGGGDANDQSGYQQMDDFIHDSQNNHIKGVWQSCYRTIARANNVVEKVVPENALRKRMIAEAKVIRAMVYLDLVSLWGDVPLILKYVPMEEFKGHPRVDKAEVYAQIEKDLTEAIVELPLKSVYGAADKFRISKGTAQAFLGKAQLFQGKDASALTNLELVIDSDEYGLENSVAQALNQKGEFGIESLFELSLVTTQSYDWGNYPWDFSKENNIIVQLMGPRGDAPGNYKAAKGDSLIAGWGFNLPTKKLYDAYVAAGDVNRRKQTLMSEAELVAAEGSFGTGWDYEEVIRRKYGTFKQQAGGPVTELNYGTNWRLLRYADVLLMAAEASYETDAAKARGYLNLVRQRTGTGLPAVDGALSGANLFNAIVTERNLELAFEGHRFIDLVRWGLAEQELEDLGFEAGKHELLPIPQQDVLAGGLSQNDGYQ